MYLVILVLPTPIFLHGRQPVDTYITLKLLQLLRAFSKHVASFKEEDPAIAVLYCLEKCYEKRFVRLLWFSMLSAVGDFATECSVCERAGRMRERGV
jgi:hypothetical protein